jgi:lipoprotein signal peptidase
MTDPFYEPEAQARGPADAPAPQPAGSEPPLSGMTPDASRDPALVPPVSARWHLASHLRLWVFAAIGLALDLGTKHLAFTRLSLDPDDPAGVIIPNVMSFRRSLNPGALFGLGKGLVPVFIAASILALGFVLYLFMHSSRDRRSLHVALGLVLAGALGNLYDRSFVIADVVKVTAVSPRTGKTVTGYHAGAILEQSPAGIRLAEGLLDPSRVSDPQVAPYAITIRPEWNPVHRRQGVVRDFIKMEPRISLPGIGTIHIWPWVFNLADSWLVIGVGLLLLNFWWDHQAEKARAAGNEPAT